MEPYAAKTCLLSLLSFGMNIGSYTTDRSSTIETMMKADSRLENINHEYDVWHWISVLKLITFQQTKYYLLECVMKDIWKHCKAKHCSNLVLWKESITNMMWWSFAESCKSDFNLFQTSHIVSYPEGSEEDLKEKILSIPHHCSDSHLFPNNKHHTACAHGDLCEEDRQKPWLEEGSKV